MTTDPGPARLPQLRPEDLSVEQRRLFDSIATGPRASGPQAFALLGPGGGLVGPFNAMLLSPPVGSALQAVGAAVRYRSALSDRAREIAILVVAHHWQSAFEIFAHEELALRAGLSGDELRAIRDAPADLVDPVERVVALTAGALSRSGDLDDDGYATARDALGDRVLFELTTIVGYYAALALQLRVYRVGRPAG